MIWLQVLLLIGGLALIVFGADWLVDGASGIARRFGLSEFVIGLTIVGMGTSAPEMVVSFIGAFQGNADIAIGNVVGSNIMNTLLILGVTALILPMAITPSNWKRDIPMNILITVLLIVLGLEYTIFHIGTNGLSRWDGGILIALFIGYMILSFKGNKPDEEDSPATQRSSPKPSESATSSSPSPSWPAAPRCRNWPPAWSLPPRRRASSPSATSSAPTSSTSC